MKYLSCCAFCILVAGSALTTPVGAHQAPAVETAEVEPPSNVIPEVNIEIPSVEIPEITLGADVVQIPELQIPEVHFDPLLETLPQLDVVQERQSAAGQTERAKTETKSKTHEEFTIGSLYQNIATSYSTEMAKKTREIALLRQVLALKLSARDIEKALPLLKEMKDVDRVAPVKPEQALDEELNTLLRAKPGDPMPPSSSEALRDGAYGVRARRQAIWVRMAQSIGTEKAHGIRAMLRSESSGSWNLGSFNQFFTSPGATSTSPTQLFRSRGGESPKSKPDSVPEPGAAPRAADPADNADELEIVRPAIGTTLVAPNPRNQRAPAEATAVSPPDDGNPAVPGAAPAIRQERSSSRVTRVQRSINGSPNALVVTPGTHILTLGQNGAHTELFYSGYSRATLTELIDLFERKLVAMRR